MGRCPQCGEEYGWRQILRHVNCSHCGSPVRLGVDGKVETYARVHAAEVLSQPRGTAYWVLLGIGVAVTALSSATFFLPIPFLDEAVIGLVLPLAQALLLERSVQRYEQHLDFAHGSLAGLYSGVVFMVMVVVQSVALGVQGAINVPSALVSVPFFLLVWWFYTKYYEGHFRRLAAGRPPSTIEVTLAAVVVGVLVVPPVAVMLAVLVASQSA